MAYFTGKKLSAIDRAQQAEIRRQKAVDEKHDAQFAAIAMSLMLVVIWCAVLTFAVLQK